MSKKAWMIAAVAMALAVVATMLRARRAAGAEISFDVQGKVTLIGGTAKAPVKDASNVAVWLAPEGAADVAQAVRPGTYEMVQRDKKFEPSLLVVPVGSTVWFPNRDPWFHNVFSLYRGKRFDLGLYQAGETKPVRFDRLGASYLFCNIHPEMSAVVLTVDSQYFGLSDASGRIAISDVPPGKYRMHVWYENADAAALDDLTRDVTVGEEQHALPAASIAIVPHDLRAHKNKFGEDYDSGALDPTY